MERIEGIAGKVFTAPSPAKTAGPLALLALVTGLLAFGTDLPGLEATLLVLVVPFVVGPALAVAVCRGLGGSTYPRRTYLLALINAGIVLLLVGVGKLLGLVGSRSSSQPGSPSGSGTSSSSRLPTTGMAGRCRWRSSSRSS